MFIIRAGEEQHHRHAAKGLAEIVQYLVGAQQRVALADAGQKYDGVFRGVFLDIADDQAVVIVDAEQVAHGFDDAVNAAAILKTVALVEEAFFLQRVDDVVV